jgi:hypothetical protein
VLAEMQGKTLGWQGDATPTGAIQDQAVSDTVFASFIGANLVNTKPPVPIPMAGPPAPGGALPAGALPGGALPGGALPGGALPGGAGIRGGVPPLGGGLANRAHQAARVSSALLEELQRVAKICELIPLEKLFEAKTCMHLHMSLLPSATKFLGGLMGWETGKQLSTALTQHAPFMAAEAQATIEALVKWRELLVSERLLAPTDSVKSKYLEELEGLLASKDIKWRWEELSVTLIVKGNASDEARSLLVAVRDGPKFWEACIRYVCDCTDTADILIAVEAVKANAGGSTLPDFAQKFVGRGPAAALKFPIPPRMVVPFIAGQAPMAAVAQGVQQPVMISETLDLGFPEVLAAVHAAFNYPVDVDPLVNNRGYYITSMPREVWLAKAGDSTKIPVQTTKGKWFMVKITKSDGTPVTQRVPGFEGGRPSSGRNGNNGNHGNNGNNGHNGSQRYHPYRPEDDRWGNGRADQWDDRREPGRDEHGQGRFNEDRRNYGRDERSYFQVEDRRDGRRDDWQPQRQGGKGSDRRNNWDPDRDHGDHGRPLEITWRSQGGNHGNRQIENFQRPAKGFTAFADRTRGVPGRRRGPL